MTSRLRLVAAAATVVVAIAELNLHADEWPSTAGTQAGATTERLIGLLVLPDVIGPPCGRAGAARQRVYGSPGKVAPSLGSLWFLVTPRPGDGACNEATLLLEAANRPASRMPTLEIGYEEQALIVVENRAPWYRVKAPEGTVWVERASRSDFTAYERLLIDALTYLEADWDMRLWPSPDAAGAFSVGERWHRDGIPFPVDVLEHRMVSGVSWLRVRLRRESCGEAIADPPEPTGWVQAYRPDGRTAVWFHSRGC